ncbi:DUF3300 domain-containing protein [Dongia mobilis]|uniref:DUF3300 domain-containing protein n=1 Tax=Dongia sp. TaxID=1977262 RepID=UPI0026EEC2D1
MTVRSWWLCLAWLAFALSGQAISGLALPRVASAQETISEEQPAGAELALLGAAELEQLVAPVAFYPDEVLAVTLPAATYPLDIVQASRFLQKHESAPDAEPNANWDPSVLALLNYPTVLNMMNDDLDWTTSLGEAVLNQQAEVIDAIQQVRRSAYTAGYLKSDDKTLVIAEADVIEIAPADPKVVYVPIYEAPPPTVSQPIAEEPAAEVTNNVYYPPAPTYSEPYTPYYNETANFWTGALLGGVTMGFLMNWDDDDIDIDFDEGDFDNWQPGRGDDINIGGDVNIGNDVAVGKGDSWRKMREQRTGGEQVSQLKSTRPAAKAAQPIASQQSKLKGQKPVGSAAVKKKPAQVAVSAGAIIPH